MSSKIQDGFDYARTTGDSILTLLGMQNQHLERILNKPEPKPLSKLNVISEAQLRSIGLPAGLRTMVAASSQGQFTKINHWAALMAAAGTIDLYYGDDQTQYILDTETAPVAKSLKSNPNELIVPPEFNVYAQPTVESVLTLSITTYGLTL